MFNSNFILIKIKSRWKCLRLYYVDESNGCMFRYFRLLSVRGYYGWFFFWDLGKSYNEKFLYFWGFGECCCIFRDCVF